jgi:6-pyruvoyl tetrahydropterin synthase/QueD family protein
MRTVTRRFQFCYAHHLPNYEGRCCVVHGHNAVVEVTFTPPEPTIIEEGNFPKGHYPGMILDFSDIKKIVGPIIDAWDHQDLNNFFGVPTAENMVDSLMLQIRADPTIGRQLVKIRLYETNDCWTDWEADK